jgi:hypothetical protein
MTPIASRQTGLNERTRHGRAVNAVAEYFRSSLSVPNIYIEPKPAALPFDLLAVDRAGSGDLHGAEIKSPNNVASLLNFRAYLAQSVAGLAEWPVHFRYLALPHTSTVKDLLPKLDLFSPDGFGRVGILLLTEPSSGLPQVDLTVQPERYRVPASAMEKVDRFLAHARPDIETRI